MKGEKSDQWYTQTDPQKHLKFEKKEEENIKGKLQTYQQQQKLIGNQVFNNVHLVLWLTVNFTFGILLGVNCQL